MKRIAAGIVSFIMSGGAADAALIVPGGLQPGDVYQLAFLSSTDTTATSSDIAGYDAIVQALANAAGIGASEGVTWSVIASTATVDARDHAVVSAPVYNMAGELVASGFDDFWDGTHTVGVGIDYEEDGTGRSANVWTGTAGDGTGAAGYELGMDSAAWGESALSSISWTLRGYQPTTVEYRLYALSSPLEVPIPLPGAAALAVAGFGLVLPWVNRRGRREWRAGTQPPEG